jgi:serine/threonine protein kinase
MKRKRLPDQEEEGVEEEYVYERTPAIHADANVPDILGQQHLSPKMPPNDCLYCWGSLPRRPVNFGDVETLPFLRRDGIGIYSTVTPSMLMGTLPTKKQKRRSIDRMCRWCPWSGESPPEGVIIGGFAKITRFLGGGTYGKVYEAKIISAEFPGLRENLVAIKFFSMCQTGDQTPLTSFYREAEVSFAIHAATGRCNAVVRPKGTFAYMSDPTTLPAGYYPAVIMELAEYGSVSEMLKSDLHMYGGESLRVIKLLMVLTFKMCESLECLHFHGYYQQDVKPTNFLCFKDRDPRFQYGGMDYFGVKLGDMGLACRLGGTLTRCMPTGTTLYVAPELEILKENQVKSVESSHMLESSERYSLACSVRDLFWICRKTLPVVKASVRGFWGRDKRAERKKFVRHSKSIINKSTMTAVEKAMKNSPNFDEEDICDAQLALAGFDGILKSMIRESWTRRPMLSELASAAKLVYEILSKTK